MSTTIQIEAYAATIEDYKWKSDNAEFAALLNSMLNPLGPSGDDPAPDYHAALKAIEILGGKIVDYELPESTKGEVY